MGILEGIGRTRMKSYSLKKTRIEILRQTYSERYINENDKNSLAGDKAIWQGNFCYSNL